MKGGTYQEIAEGGIMRFSNNDDRAKGIVHNSSGEADVQLIRSLFPGKDDDHIINHIDSKGTNTYNWLRNISALGGDATHVEEQFKTLNYNQRLNAIKAANNATKTRLADPNFSYERKGNDEIARERESGRIPELFKLKNGYSADATAISHKNTVQRVMRTEDNFKTIHEGLKEEIKQKEYEKSKAAAASAAKTRESEQTKERTKKYRELSFKKEIELEYISRLNKLIAESKSKIKGNAVSKLSKKIEIQQLNIELKGLHNRFLKKKNLYNLSREERNNILNETIPLDGASDISQKHKEISGDQPTLDELNERLAHLQTSLQNETEKQYKKTNQRKKNKSEAAYLEAERLKVEKEREKFEEKKQREEELYKLDKEKRERVNRIKREEIARHREERRTEENNNTRVAVTLAKKYQDLIDQINDLISKEKISKEKNREIGTLTSEATKIFKRIFPPLGTWQMTPQQRMNLFTIFKELQVIIGEVTSTKGGVKRNKTRRKKKRKSKTKKHKKKKPKTRKPNKNKKRRTKRRS